MENYLPAEVSFSLMKLRRALVDSLTSRYLFACAVYVAYSVGMILAGSPQLDTAARNKYYFMFGVVHLINSFMFIWTWEGKSLIDKVMIPEYLNVAGAAMYLWSSTLYGHEYQSDDDGAGYSSSFHLERNLEFWASVVEVAAAFGWIYSWHVGYLELIADARGPIPSRGWTFDDPDLSANITIAAAAIIYFVYNCQVVSDYSQYESNELYKLGDQIYLLNSVLYFLAALRDCDWFWFLPKFGRYRTVTEIMKEESEDSGGGMYSKVNHSDGDVFLNGSAETDQG